QTITITGSNDAADITVTATDTSVTEDDASNNTATGTISVFDVDTGEGTLLSSTASYGTVVVDGTGVWEYSLDDSNAAVQALPDGETLTDTITFTSDDGTTETQTITITGSNDAADITVTASDTSVTEDDASNNTAIGTVSVSDIDTGEGTLVSSTASYGTVVVDGTGVWEYSLDDSNAAVQALPAGQTLVDTITFTSDDGTTETQTITINGTDDVPTISGDFTGSVTEDESFLLSTSGDLNASGGDAGENNFQEASLSGTYGQLAVSANGGWEYIADNGKDVIQGLTQNQTLTDSFTVFNADGVTSETVIITIHGTDDVPTISGDVTGSVKEDDTAILTTNGKLIADYGDAGEDKFIAENLNGTYGSLVITADGSWTYSADNSQGDIQALNDGDTLTETFMVTNADGVTTQTVTISINGTDGDPVAVNDNGSSLVSGGFYASYYSYHEAVEGENLDNLSTIRNYMENNNPDANFIATELNYGEINGDLGRGMNLQTFLGEDAQTLSTDPDNSSDAILHFKGLIDLSEGVYNFQILADDGYVILIDGEEVAVVDKIQSPTATTHELFTITNNPDGSSLHDIEIIYWDQGGRAVFQVELSNPVDETPFGVVTYSLLNGENFPLLSNYGYTAPEDNNFIVDSDVLLSNDTDAEEDTLTVVDVGNASNGASVSLVDGIVTLTPAEGFVGFVTFDYTISDGVNTDVATVTVEFTPGIDTLDDSYSFAASTTIPDTDITELAKGTKDESVTKTYSFGEAYAGQTIQVTLTTEVIGGWDSGDNKDFFSISGSEGNNQYYTYDNSDDTDVPSGGTIIYEVVLDSNGEANVTFTAETTADNEAINITDITATLVPTSFILDVLENDPNTDKLSIESVEEPVDDNGISLGTVEIINDTQIKFTPTTSGINQDVSFSYTATDGITSDSATVSVSVNGDIRQLEDKLTFKRGTDLEENEYSLGTADDGIDLTKEYDFGEDNAGKTIILTFDTTAHGSWDLNDNGSPQDYLNITISNDGNDDIVESITYDSSLVGNEGDSADADQSNSWHKSYSYEVVLDENGKVNIDFDGYMSASDEYIDITNLQATLNSTSDLSVSYNSELISGEGIDTFIWSDSDTGTDHINGFDLDEDIIDISDLLHLSEGDNLNEFLDFDSDGVDTTITVHADGDNEITQTIVLDNIDLGSDDVTIINDMLTGDHKGALFIGDSSVVDKVVIEPIPDE
ncbi:VCBS domain-containing protein, partial [Colwellia echini]